MTITNVPCSFALCLLLTVAAAAQGSAPERAQPSSSSSSVPILNPAAQVSATQSSHFLSRPLFNASRRPFVARPVIAPPALPPSSAPTASHIRLIGTMRQPTGVTALLQAAGPGTSIMVPLGGIIDGWRITDIEASMVRIEQGGKTIDLDLFKPELRPSSASTSRESTSISTPMPGPAVASPVAQTGSSTPVTPGNVHTLAPGIAPSGILAGTAAAGTIANSPYRLTFGGTPTATKP